MNVTIAENGDEELDREAMQAVVDACVEAFGENTLYTIGQSLSALLGMYFFRLGTNERRLAVSKLIMDGAISACQQMQEQENRTVN